MQRAVARLEPLPDSPVRVSLAHNRTILSQPLSTEGLVVLACPATGTGLVLSVVEAVCMRALEVAPPFRQEWLRAFVAKQPVTLHRHGQTVQGAEEQVSVLAKELEAFCAHRVPKLIQMGIVEPLTISPCQA
jgi:hypothetical protein